VPCFAALIASRSPSSDARATPWYRTERNRAWWISAGASDARERDGARADARATRSGDRRNRD